MAATNKAEWVEFDISFTKDNIAVVFHDNTMDRVTNLTGPITQYTYSELAMVDLTIKHNSSTVSPVRIPRVEQMIEECLKHNLKMIIDLKTWKVPRQTTALLLRLYQEFPKLKEQSMLTSFYPHLLYFLRRNDSNIISAISVDRNLPNLVELTVWHMVGFSCILAYKDVVTEEYRDRWDARGVRVMAWTVNSAEEKYYMKNDLKIQVLTDTITVL